tara:strand:- start:281 stop:886 length:606 start_codon:yes stop_codon:yes gene_type:complete
VAAPTGKEKSPDSIEQKRDLRRRLDTLRKRQDIDFINTSRWQVANQLRALISRLDLGVIALYSARDGEVDMESLATELQGLRFTLCLPRVAQRGMPLVFNLWRPGGWMDSDDLEIPCAAGPEVTPQLVILPGLGFTREGYRLGFGGGYYDRTLAEIDPRPITVMVAYSFQEVDTLPVEAHDIPVDYIVTEKETIETKPTKK